ncbi:hypothetical protein BASA81_001256 [Batrachochytrium salamandrivorans]|nr:hypothetical protein BASA81_001256 [Batrachochytrium salamandrivorans]
MATEAVTDRFGFIVQTVVSRVPPREVELEAKRCEKWRKMLQSKTPSRKLHSRLVKGIPEPFRALVWAGRIAPTVVAAPAESLLDSKSKLLLSGPEGAKIYDAISKDLGRTLPTHLFFRGELGQQALERVLCAYANVDREVGFTQGMSFIAALFLLYLNEVQSFELLRTVMETEPCSLREIFRPPNMDGVHLRLMQYGKLLQLHLPKVAKHFTLIQFEPHMYAVNWFASVFTASQFPFPVICRIWDMFLFDGWPAVFKVTIAFWKLLERELVKLQRFEQVFELYRAVLVDFASRTDELFAIASKFKITQRDLLKL